MTYYETLGVSENSSFEEIKQKYRQLAKEHHPDKNQGDDTEFKKIAEAYETLSDENKRKRYDYSLKGNPEANFGFDGFQDMFNDFFSSRSAPRQQKVSAINLTIKLSLKDNLKDLNYSLTYNKQIICSSCKGTKLQKDKSYNQCPKCNGKGYSMMRNGMFIINQTCNYCNGQGKFIKKEDLCTHCRGKGVENKECVLNLLLPKFSKPGLFKILEKQGNEALNCVSGDINVFLEVLPENGIYRTFGFSNKNLDLYCEKEISILNILIGSKCEIENIYDDVIQVFIPENCPNGAILKVENQGIKDNNKIGDLYVQINHKFPILNDEQKQIIAKNVLGVKNDEKENNS